MKHFRMILVFLLTGFFALSCAKKNEETVATGSPLPAISVQCGANTCM